MFRIGTGFDVEGAFVATDRRSQRTRPVGPHARLASEPERVGDGWAGRRRPTLGLRFRRGTSCTSRGRARLVGRTSGLVSGRAFSGGIGREDPPNLEHSRGERPAAGSGGAGAQNDGVGTVLDAEWGRCDFLLLWRCLALFKGHLGWIQEIACHPNRALVATVGEDGLLCIWEPQTAKPILSQEVNKSGGLSSVDWSPQGTWLATGTNDGVVSLFSVEGIGGRA